jgi:putative tryptophan/tyrosine transport system substrate-binding protein
VVFLSVSSSVDRGIVASMVSSGNNFTGIDTNDTNLTAKRLWFIRKVLPEAKKVFCFHVPSSVPSVKALAVARQSASDLGFELQAVEVESQEDIKKATATLSKTTTDVILLLPTVPTDKAMHSIIFPRAMAEKIPIFGFSETNIESGAFASYAGSRYANGEQAARLIHKIVNGTAPKDIPIETPDKFELVINKDVVAQLGLKVSDRFWRMADRIVDIKLQP